MIKKNDYLPSHSTQHNHTEILAFLISYLSFPDKNPLGNHLWTNFYLNIYMFGKDYFIFHFNINICGLKSHDTNFTFGPMKILFTIQVFFPSSPCAYFMQLILYHSLGSSLIPREIQHNENVCTVYKLRNVY